MDKENLNHSNTVRGFFREPVELPWSFETERVLKVKDWLRNKRITSRYATKSVDVRFYHTITIESSGFPEKPVEISPVSHYRKSQ